MMVTEERKPKKVKRDKNDHGDDFIAPDGGWGWLVCLAAGISNFSIFPGVQVFGLIYKDKLLALNFTNSQITTIMNSQNATSSGTGLLNGPMFRKLSFRQVGLLGAFFVSMGLFLSAFCESFTLYLICYSIIFGFGSGIMVSASSLALNTYFKEKRRRAASFTWTITGLGPLIFPHIVTIICPILGFRGTVWLFTGISMHAFASALIYQPVKWHCKTNVKKNLAVIEDFNYDNPENICRYCQIKSQLTNKRKSKIFSSQYCIPEEDEKLTEFEFTHHGTPVLSRANDGWYGSRTSLNKINKQTNGEINQRDLISRGQQMHRSSSSIALGTYNCTCTIKEKSELNENLEVIDNTPLKWYEKVAIFFDLSLLKDLTFVNLMTGMTLSTFADFNFTVLMPFFLTDFGFSKSETAILMSLIGGADIVMRFSVPFLVENIKWDNRIFFIIAVSGMTVGRIILAHRPSYKLAIALFLWIGAFKGLRTIFLALIIPSHVPLKRLPAASGLQLLTSGFFTLLCGPIVGMIRDATNYTLTLHFLNFISSITIFSWSGQLIYEWFEKRGLKKSQDVISKL